MPEKNILISASMLPEYQDCARRAAFKGFKEECAEAGFKPNNDKPKNNIGAVIGTAGHAGIAHLLECKRDQIETTIDTAFAVGLASFAELTKKGVNTDDTSPSAGIAHEQIKAVIREFSYSVLPYSQPILVEERLAAEVGDGFMFNGGLDVFDALERIEDHKLGSREPHALSQVGGYALLLSAHDYPVKYGRLNWFPRKKKGQPAVEFKNYDIDIAKRAAIKVIKDMQRDWKEFSNTNSPEAFAPNPGSMRCKEQFCPAFNTPFCDQGGS